MWTGAVEGGRGRGGLWLSVLVAGSAAALTACGGPPGSLAVHAPMPARIASVPPGWRTYTYARAAVSAPATWAVRRDSNCPDPRAPGTLLLGVPMVPEHCPEIPASASWVVVTSPDQAASSSQLRAPGQRTVNGVHVRVGFGSPLAEVWDAPSLDVQIEAIGPLSGRILPTLRKVTPGGLAAPAPVPDGPVSIRVALERTTVRAGRPIVGVALITDDTGRPVGVEACAADGWLDVGLADGRIPYDPVSPAIACAPSVELAPGVNRIPITVATTYQGCVDQGNATADFPRCTAAGAPPPLPVGTYRVAVVTSGLPAGARTDPAPAVTLTP